MLRRVRTLLVGACLAGLLTAAPAMAATTTGTVTATGTGQTKVTPTNRNNNASIKAAYDAAKLSAITGAIADARRNAVAYAKAVGLTLGKVISVSDVQTNGYYGPGEFFGPFGPEQFCGTIRQPIFKRVGNRRKVIGTKKVHRCFVPGVAYTTLTLTYSAG